MNFRHKIRVWAAVAVVAGSFLLSASCILVQASQNTATQGGAGADADYSPGRSPVLMDVTYGYGGAAKSGRYVPVRISLKNQKSEAFQGKIRILTQQPDQDAYRADIYQYDYPVSLGRLESKEKSVNVPLGGRTNQLYVSLLGPDGQELVRKRVKMNVSQDVAELFIGILSDTPDRLQYMDGVGVDYSMVRTRAVDMTAEDMPEDDMGLNLLDVLLIDNYDTRKLSKAQVNAIMAWVKKGGTLLLGTGARASDTLAAFQPGLLDGPVGQATLQKVNMGVEYATNSPGDSFIQIPCADISLHNGTEVISSDEFPVLSATPRENGQIAVAAYDFVDIEQFCLAQRSYMDKLLTALLGGDKINDLSSSIYNGNSRDYWMVQSMINVGNVNKIPNLPLYAIVVLGYIGLVGPGLYLLLKRRERRRFYRAGILCLALAFAGIVYLMGYKTRFKGTFFTYATIKDVANDAISQSTYMNMRTPYNKPYEVRVDPAYDLYPITRNYYNDMAPAMPFHGNEDYQVAIDYEKGGTDIKVQNLVAFTPKYFSLKKKTGNPGHVGLVGTVTQFDGKISGTVTNKFPYPVADAALVLYGQMIVLGDLQPGETKQLDSLPVIAYPVSNSYIAAKRISGGYRYKEPDITNPDYMKSLARTNILNFFLTSFTSSYNPDARIVAFSQDQSDSQFLLGGSDESYGITMVTSSINVNNRQDGYVYRSGMMRRPNVISGQYYASTNMAYGMDVALEYYLGSDVTVEKLTFGMMSDEFMDQDVYGTLYRFTGSIYFYNHDTGVYDQMKKGQMVFDGSQLKPYLSPGNTITVKYVSDNTTEYNWAMMLPILTIVGKDKM